jgi:hypothetical protein
MLFLKQQKSVKWNSEKGGGMDDYCPIQGMQCCLVLMRYMMGSTSSWSLREGGCGALPKRGASVPDKFVHCACGVRCGRPERSGGRRTALVQRGPLMLVSPSLRKRVWLDDNRA